jgi:hypothetical protein
MRRPIRHKFPAEIAVRLLQAIASRPMPYNICKTKPYHRAGL